MKVKFLTHFTIGTTIFFRDGIYSVPEEKAKNWIMAGLCEPVNDDGPAIPAGTPPTPAPAAPIIETGMRSQPETTAKRRKG